MYLLQLYHAAFIIQFELPFFSPSKKQVHFQNHYSLCTVNGKINAAML